MNDYGLQEAIKSMRNRGARLEREGDFWTQDERDRLKTLFDEGIGISEIAIRLQRTEPAVFQQSEKLDLYERKSYPKRRRHSAKKGSCLCRQCTADSRICPLCKHREEEERP